MSNLYNFISYDGPDDTPEHYRAEVAVQQSSGTVHEINETDKGVANVSFKPSNPNLKRNIAGWLPVDSDTYREILRAQAANEVVEFRIESQRKPGVDRKTPMSELRQNTTTAQETTRRILVGANGIYTDEMLTDPDEDPSGDGKSFPATKRDKTHTNTSAQGSVAVLDKATILERLHTAVTSNQVRQTIIDQMVAQALFNGVTPQEVEETLNANPKQDNSTPAENLPAGFSYEAQPWKEYNTDGRLNLGNNIIAGAVGVENLIYKQIHVQHGVEGLNASNLSDVSSYFGETIYAIVDSIQQQAYGRGSKIDRSAMSHVRIRGIVYDVIDRLAHLPVLFENGQLTLNGGVEGVRAWITLVGKTSKERFFEAVKLSTSYPGFKGIKLPASLGGQATPQAPVNSPEATQPAQDVPVTQSAPEPATEAPTASQDAPKAETVTPATPAEPKKTINRKISDVQALADAVPTTGTPIETKAEREARISNEEPLVTAEEEEENLALNPDVNGDDAWAPVETDEDFLIYGPHIIQPGDTRPLASNEEVDAMKEMFNDYGFDLANPTEQKRIVSILRYTFGLSNSRQIPAEELMNFVDHYVASGPTALHKVLELASN